MTRVALVLMSALLAAPFAAAQTAWTVDRKLSNAWWQVVPHLGHLWATTCPGDFYWQPGDGRSDGWNVKRKGASDQGNTVDTLHVPLFPRPVAEPNCVEAVEGKIVVSDTARWGGVRGRISVDAAALVTGDERRDLFTRRSVLQTPMFPNIQFTIDSVLITSRSADTITGTALGVFQLRGVSQPMTATIRGWPEAGGLRVQSRFAIPAHQLVPVYRISKMALGLGVGARLWEYVFAGVDVVLKPDPGSQSSAR